MLRPVLLKMLAVLLMLTSAGVVWSECLFSVRKPVLSLFAALVHVAATNYSYWIAEVSVLK